MKLVSMKLCAVAIAFIAITAGCTGSDEGVDSAVQGWRGSAGDGNGRFGGRGRYDDDSDGGRDHDRDDDDADGGSDERDCRDRWRRGLGDHSGHGHENGDDNGGDENDGRGGRR